MSNGLKTEDLSKAQTAFSVSLRVSVPNIPSFKNRKRAIPTKSGKFRTLTEPKVKQRMEQLENAIVSALYSACQTASGGTDSECLKRARIALSGLSDDSWREIPESSFLVTHDPANPGLEIIIEKL